MRVSGLWLWYPRGCFFNHGEKCPHADLPGISQTEPPGSAAVLCCAELLVLLSRTGAARGELALEVPLEQLPQAATASPGQDGGTQGGFLGLHRVCALPTYCLLISIPFAHLISTFLPLSYGLLSHIYTLLKHQGRGV